MILRFTLDSVLHGQALLISIGFMILAFMQTLSAANCMNQPKNTLFTPSCAKGRSHPALF
jgi:hypothetical protein